jgi:antitoxin CcdA
MWTIMRMTDNIADMHRSKPSASKRATNITLPQSLLAEAKAMGISISKAAETGVALAVAEKRAQLWAQENHGAIESSNAYVERHGLPLAKHRIY